MEAQYLLQNSRAVPEREFQTWFGKWARANEWLYYHTENSKRSPAGFPDCVLIRIPEIIVVELKSCLRTANVSSAQMEWLRSFEAVGVETHVWRPSDIPAIMKRLRMPSCPM